MQAIGNDGKWHEWEELSAEEKADWERCMTIADQRRKERYENGRMTTLRESLLYYEEKRRWL